MNEQVCVKGVTTRVDHAISPFLFVGLFRDALAINVHKDLRAYNAR